MNEAMHAAVEGSVIPICFVERSDLVMMMLLGSSEWFRVHCKRKKPLHFCIMQRLLLILKGLFLSSHHE